MDVFAKHNNKFSKCELIPQKFEKNIETFLEKHPYVLDDGFDIIGRQVKIEDIRIDLLGLDSKNNLVIIEIKRDKAKRKAVYQIVDYALLLDINDYARFYQIIKSKIKIPERLKNLTYDNLEKFNNNPRLYIVAEYIDAKTKDRVEKLNKKDFSIECVEIQFFENDKITVNKLFSNSSSNLDKVTLNCDLSVLKLVKKIRKCFKNLSDVVEFQSKKQQYISFKHNGHNFASLHIKKHKLLGHIIKEDLYDPKHKTKLHARKKHHGRVHEMIINESDLQYFKSLAKQTYHDFD